MKKMFSFFAAVALIAALNSSCKKNFTCECCATCFGNTNCASSTAKMKKKDAKNWCETQAGSTAGCTYKCELK